MSPLDISGEDVLLAILLAAIVFLIATKVVHRIWPNLLLCKLPLVKSNRYCKIIQTFFIVLITSLLIAGIGILHTTPEAERLLNSNIFASHQTVTFMWFFVLLTVLSGWLVSRQIRWIVSKEEQLLANEERTRRVFEYSPTGIVFVGSDGLFQALNPAFCRMVGFEEADLVGQSLIEITHPDDRERSLEEIHQLIEGNKDPIILEKRYRRKNGEFFWAAVVGTIVRNSSGHPLFLIGQVQDITARREAENALRLSEAKFRLLVENSLTGVYIIQDGKFVYVNPRLAEMIDYSEEELIQLPSIMEVVAEADRPLTEKQIQLLITGQARSSHFTLHGLCKNGTQIIAEVLSSATEYNGRPAVLGTVLNVTQQKYAEEALRATIENTPNVSVQWYDADGRVLFWNRASEKIFGWSATEVIGKTLDQFLLSLENTALFFETLSRIAATNQAEGPAEYKFTRRNGETGCCLSTTFAIPSPGGQPRFVCMDIDITHQKATETALRELSGRLLNLQDEERRRIARELHDTTAQSLAALTMNLSLLQRSDLNLHEKTRKILDESLHLAECSMQEIRTLSYLLHPPELDMVGLVSAIRQYASGFGNRSGIETLVNIPPDFQRLTPQQELTLFRIIQEGLGNILRHARTATAQITLKRTKSHILLEIRDWGKGIPKPVLKTINQMQGQFGVGFAGMQERLRHLDGTLKVSSSPAGTTVQAIIPTKD